MVHDTGKIVPFAKKTPTETTINVRKRTTEAYMQAAQTVFNASAKAANVNALGDYDKLAVRHKYRTFARWHVDDTHKRILIELENHKPIESHITFASYTHEVLAQLRDLVSLKSTHTAPEFTELACALDAAVGHANDAIFELENRQPVAWL